MTDSAAAGTALASGHKTGNGVLGMSADLSAPVRSIAEQAKAAGAAVGIATSVSVDHATPAAFYAHVGNRSCYHEIGAGSELFGGRVDNTVIPEKIAEATGWTLSSPSR